MNRRPSVRLLLLASAVVLGVRVAHLAGAGPHGGQAQAPARESAERRAITERDLFDFNWVADPQVSPDGSRVAFTRVAVDAKRTGYETSIWMVPATGATPPVRLTAGTGDSEPRWSPDGQWIAFVRAPGPSENGKGEAPQLALLPLSGGEARTMTDLPKGAAGPVWSPDGKRIAFLSRTTDEDIRKQGEQAGAGERQKEQGQQPGTTAVKSERPAEGAHESDVHVITRAVYQSNDAGYLDPSRHLHIWIVDVPAPSAEPGQPRHLTMGDFDEHDPLWSPDGSRVYYLTTRIVEPYYELPTTDLYSVPAGGGDPQKIATIAMGVQGPALSPDGRRVAFHAAVNEPVRSYSQPDAWVMDLAPGAVPRNLTGRYDSDVGDPVFGDNAAPRGGGGPALHWAADGRSLLDVASARGRTQLIRLDAASGAVSDISRGDHAVLDFSATPDGRTIVALASTPVLIGDLFAIGADGTERRLTDVNQTLWSKLALTAPEEFTYTSFDGTSIQAWIQKPPDFDPAKTYPLILNIHGGPHAAYGWVFDHEFQWMAARGYVVLYPNPRGSTSYGQEFGNVIQYHYPGDDYRDLMIGVDELLRRGYVDPGKLAVTGGSGGGVLTNWTVTHTDRFAAAVSQRDISNWACWWYTADFTLFQPNWFKAPPFQDPEDYRDRSAITFVQNIHTPTMFVLGERDSRTPPECGGEQLFRALKFLKRPTAMVMFPRETHELSRSGEPWHRIERLQHIVGWFDTWLLGMPHPEYDVSPGKAAGNR